MDAKYRRFSSPCLRLTVNQTAVPLYRKIEVLVPVDLVNERQIEYCGEDQSKLDHQSADEHERKKRSFIGSQGRNKANKNDSNMEIETHVKPRLSFWTCCRNNCSCNWILPIPIVKNVHTSNGLNEKRWTTDTLMYPTNLTATSSQSLFPKQRNLNKERTRKKEMEPKKENKMGRYIFSIPKHPNTTGAW